MSKNPKFLKKSVNFQRGGGVQTKNPSVGGGGGGVSMDIFWNNKMFKIMADDSAD